MSLTAEPPAQASKPSLSEPIQAGDLLGHRIAAALIDFAVLGVAGVALSVVLGEATTRDGQFSFRMEGPDFVLYLGVILLYYFVFEATIGQSLGKLLISIRVVGPDGCRPSALRVAGRTILRLVDWLPLLYLVGFLSMMGTGAHRRRLGDRAAKTDVVRATPLSNRGMIGALIAALLLIGLVVSVSSAPNEEQQSQNDPGISFDYPPDWGDFTGEADFQESSGNELWSKTVGVGGADVVAIAAYRMNLPVTTQNLDQAKTSFTPLAQNLFDDLGGSLHSGPTEITVAGLPAIEYAGTGVVRDTPVQSRIVIAFDGDIEYFFNCQYTTANAEEILRGCAQMLRTAEVD